MSMTPDYGEPWSYDTDFDMALTRNASVGEATRAVACVNACAGMADPAAEIESMREAIRESLAMLLEIEYQGNDKGTRCIICGTHCCEPHEVDCALRQAIQKTKPFLPNATPAKP